MVGVAQQLEKLQKYLRTFPINAYREKETLDLCELGIYCSQDDGGNALRNVPRNFQKGPMERGT